MHDQAPATATNNRSRRPSRVSRGLESAFPPDGLRALLPGRVVLPTDERWDAARQAWNLAADQRPAAVAFAETAADVSAVVGFARSWGLRVAAQGTGHGASPLGPLGDTILLKTERMREIRIDAPNRTARVGAGALWGDVAVAAEAHGLAGLAGSSPDVGVVGYSLGGGLGWLARLHGAAASSITAAGIITADGRLVRVDRDHEPDLFWAIRGGGGSFGVVAALEFTLHPVSSLFAGDLFWPIDRAGEVLRAWRTWIDDLPDSVTSLSRLLRVPPLPDVPEPLRGRAFVLVEAAMAMPAVEGADLLQPLRALGPEIDTFATIRPSQLKELHMDPEQPVPGVGDGMLLADVTPRTADALLDVAGPMARTPLLSVEVRHLGGALLRTDPACGAFSVDAGFALYAIGMAMTPEMGAAASQSLGRLRDRLDPWRAEHAYLNFAERSVDTAGLFTTETHERLRRIKREWDPGDLFRSNHPI